MPLILAISIVFGLIGGIMAYIITWLEYRRHKLKGWRLIQPCLSTAGGVFLFFVALGGLFGFFLLKTL
ncbi:MAG TPA: hypothetical protein VF402_10015 [Asticcacaulis sp.]